MMGALAGFVTDPHGDLCLATQDGELSGLADWRWQEMAEEQTGQSTQEVADEVGVIIYRARPGEDEFTQVTH
jgi:hypothetical protein